jgi:hypothetical protein
MKIVGTEDGEPLGISLGASKTVNAGATEGIEDGDWFGIISGTTDVGVVEGDEVGVSENRSTEGV